MERWTIKDLNSISDIDFAINILNERGIKLNPFSPLGSKLSNAVATLEKLRDEKGMSAGKPEMSVRRKAILDFIKFEAETSVVWPWAMSATEMCHKEGFLSAVEKAAPFDEGGSCETDDLYAVIDTLAGVNPACSNPPELDLRDNTLAGGYILVSTYATLSDEEAKALRDTDETPTAVIAVKKDFLEEWIKPEYTSLEEFFGDYTYDAIEGLMGAAILHNAFAFEYRDGLDDPLIFGGGLDGDAVLAYTDFLSGKLQENGHEEASKYLDCLFSL